MDILCSIDHRFEMQLYVTLYSLFESNAQDHFHIHLITTNMSAQQQKKIEHWVKEQKQDITFYTIPEELQNNDMLPKEGRFPISSYMRCFVAEILPKDLHRILYLDCDILIHDSLSELWNTDLEGYALAAVDDMWAMKDNADRLGYDAKYSYFNSGVLLINLDEWRKVDTYHQALKFIESHLDVLQFPDQDVLNGLFHAKRKVLHPRYNMQDTFFRHKRKYVHPEVLKMVDEYLDTPSIVHFTCSHKPWDYKCYHPWRKNYLKTIKNTPFQSFKVPKGKMSDKLEVPVNRVLWSLRIITPKYRKVQVPKLK